MISKPNTARVCPGHLLCRLIAKLRGDGGSGQGRAADVVRRLGGIDNASRAAAGKRCSERRDVQNGDNASSQDEQQDEAPGRSKRHRGWVQAAQDAKENE